MKPSAATGSCCGSRRSAAVVRSPRLDDVRSESDLLRVIASGRDDCALTSTFLALLDERHDLYRGVDTPGVIRMRGALLQALGDRALPVTALPFVLEELESAHDATLTAIAARALRRFPEPAPAFAEPLMSALSYIRHRDEIVRMRADDGGEAPTTATREVIQTIGWLGRAGLACVPRLEQLLDENPGPSTSRLLADAVAAIRGDDRADVCESPRGAADPAAPPAAAIVDVSSVRFEDHDGNALTFADVFRGHPSIVVFFYTRCDNPAKCPLTMYKLGNLQRMLPQHPTSPITTAAITYDPDYDTPQRLLQYAESWGVKPSATHRLLRTVSGFGAVREYFSLGVNFSASGIVNRHQLEAYVLDASGRVAHAVTRQRWDEAKLIDLAGAPSPQERGARAGSSR